MLKPGHEGELVCWLKTIGLIPQYIKCKNAEMNENCKKPLCWYTSKSMDNYQWKCLNCQRKYSIRENSLFHDIKCNFKDAIRVFLGWCKEKDTETLMKILGEQKHSFYISQYKNCNFIVFLIYILCFLAWGERIR